MLNGEIEYLGRDRQHAIDLAEFAPQLVPGIAAVIAAVQIPVTAAGEHDIGRIGPRVHRPHGRVGRCWQVQTLPRFTHIFGAHHGAGAPRSRVTDSQKNRLRLIRWHEDAAGIGPREGLADM